MAPEIIQNGLTDTFFGFCTHVTILLSWLSSRVILWRIWHSMLHMSHLWPSLYRTIQWVSSVLNVRMSLNRQDVHNVRNFANSLAQSSTRPKVNWWTRIYIDVYFDFWFQTNCLTSYVSSFKLTCACNRKYQI